MIFKIQLIGGPDDGATFRAWRLTETWEMLHEGTALACKVLRIPEESYTVVYLFSNHRSMEGHYLYYHEDMNLNLQGEPV